MYCKKCLNEVKEDWKYCPKCKTILLEENIIRDEEFVNTEKSKRKRELTIYLSLFFVGILISILAMARIIPSNLSTLGSVTSLVTITTSFIKFRDSILVKVLFWIYIIAMILITIYVIFMLLLCVSCVSELPEFIDSCRGCY